MGTRGAIGFYRDGRTKATYNHFDSYPDVTGAEMVEYCKRFTVDQMKDVFDRLYLVSSRAHPSEEECEKFKSFADVSVGDVRVGASLENIEWYQLLRDMQGTLKHYHMMDGYLAMIDGSKFLQDSLFCEYAYIVNLDDEALEFYVGFQKEPDDNRYQPEEPDDQGYWGVKLVDVYPLKDLVIEDTETIVGLMNATEPDE